MGNLFGLTKLANARALYPKVCTLRGMEHPAHHIPANPEPQALNLRGKNGVQKQQTNSNLKGTPFQEALDGTPSAPTGP